MHQSSDMPQADRADKPPWHAGIVHRLHEMNYVIAKVLHAMSMNGYSDKEQFGVRLSLEEAIVNGIKHGNQLDPDKKVHVRYQVSPQEICIEIEDEGPGFNPDRVPNPLSPENLERPGGRGVFLMRHYMTSVQFNERGNRVSLCKLRGK